MGELIHFKPSAEIYLHSKPMDMRLGAEKLSARVRAWFGNRDFKDGGLFVFVSKNRRRSKILYWDKTGWAVWYKTLEVGTFQVEQRNGRQRIEAVDLKRLLSGKS